MVVALSVNSIALMDKKKKTKTRPRRNQHSYLNAPPRNRLQQNLLMEEALNRYCLEGEEKEEIPQPLELIQKKENSKRKKGEKKRIQGFTPTHTHTYTQTHTHTPPPICISAWAAWQKAGIHRQGCVSEGKRSFKIYLTLIFREALSGVVPFVSYCLRSS